MRLFIKPGRSRAVAAIPRGSVAAFALLPSVFFVPAFAYTMFVLWCLARMVAGADRGANVWERCMKGCIVGPVFSLSGRYCRPSAHTWASGLRGGGAAHVCKFLLLPDQLTSQPIFCLTSQPIVAPQCANHPASRCPPRHARRVVLRRRSSTITKQPTAAPRCPPSTPPPMPRPCCWARPGWAPRWTPARLQHLAARQRTRPASRPARCSRGRRCLRCAGWGLWCRLGWGAGMGPG